MCLIAFALGQNPHFPLVVAANRDEFFARPTAAMDWWSTEDGTRILAGRDLLSGGSLVLVAGWFLFTTGAGGGRAAASAPQPAKAEAPKPAPAQPQKADTKG